MKVRPSVAIAFVALLLGVSAMRGPANDERAVRFDVAVTDKDGHPVLGLQKTDFRVFEDNVEQNITSFRVRQEPLAMVILAEFSDAYYATDVTKPAEVLVRSGLKPQDWAALVSFGSEPQIVVDFTRNKNSLVAGLRRLELPQSQDASLYDALCFVLDRLNRLQVMREKKAIFLLGTGRDATSSKHSYADVLRRATASGTMIYTVGVDQSPLVIHHPDRDPSAQVRGNGAGDTLRALAEATGGLSFFPELEGQYGGIQLAINADLRHQYTLGFLSANTKTGGKLRKLTVEVADADIDHDGKPDKLQVRNQAGYYSPAKSGETD